MTLMKDILQYLVKVLSNIQAAHAAQYQRNNLTGKMAEDLNRHFSKEDAQKAHKWHEKNAQHHSLLCVRGQLLLPCHFSCVHSVRP